MMNVYDLEMTTQKELEVLPSHMVWSCHWILWSKCQERCDWFVLKLYAPQLGGRVAIISIILKVIL